MIQPDIISYWHETIQQNPCPPLRGSIHVDVAIVGGGFTGLSTAYHLKRAAPSLRIALIEANTIAYGASGRNAGFAMTLFGLQMSLTAARFGKPQAKQAHHYMERAVDYVGTLVHDHAIDCDYERNGLLTVANAPAQARRLHHEVQLAQRLGLTGITWLDAAETRRQVNSPRYLGARAEARCALVNPAKLAVGLQRMAQAVGVEIYERTPVGALDSTSIPRLETPYGDVRAEKVVMATNAFNTRFAQLAGLAVPVYTYIVLTEPLSEAQRAPIGWAGRQGVEDGRNLVHYYRLTADNRLLMGGGDVTIPYGGLLRHDIDEHTFANLERFIGKIFPSLHNVHITHRWGGPVSVPLDMAPAIGTIGGDRRLYYSLGCVGHGVAMTIMNGCLLRDLVLEHATPLTEMFFVNRWTVPLPPEPLLFATCHGLRAGLLGQDLLDERGFIS